MMAKNDWMARSLGWFSIGLGVAEVIAPRQVGRLMGVEKRAGLLRFYGFREIMTGIGLLAQQGPGRPSPWLWARVAGDALDIATVGTGITNANPARGRAIASTAALAGVALLDVACAEKAGRNEQKHHIGNPPGVVARSLTIGKPADELYRLWREPQVMANIMAHFAEVESRGDGREHWRLPLPRGKALEWDSQVIEDRPGEFVRWQSQDGATVPNGGSVQFRPAPGDRGTEVTLRLEFDPPGGAIGDTVAAMFSNIPDTAAEKTLRRFKSLVETGEIPTTRPQPAARADKD